MSEILAEATFPSVIHNNEVCEEIVKWGNKNGFPLTKAKLYNQMEGYVGFLLITILLKQPVCRLFLVVGKLLLRNTKQKPVLFL